MHVLPWNVEKIANVPDVRKTIATRTHAHNPMVEYAQEIAKIPDRIAFVMKATTVTSQLVNVYHWNAPEAQWNPQSNPSLFLKPLPEPVHKHPHAYDPDMDPTVNKVLQC